MTCHIRSAEYECKNCHNVFIAYQKGLECSNCSTPEASDGSAYSFIDELIASMRAHKRKYGTYMPPAWYEGNLSDWVQQNVYRLFDVIEALPNKDFEFIMRGYSGTDGKKDPDRMHIVSIANELYAREEELKLPRVSLLSKLKNIFG